MDGEEITKSMDVVASALHEAAKHNLQIEVVTWALKYMKEDPTISIEEAITMGLNEWVK